MSLCVQDKQSKLKMILEQVCFCWASGPIVQHPIHSPAGCLLQSEQYTSYVLARSAGNRGDYETEGQREKDKLVMTNYNPGTTASMACKRRRRRRTRRDRTGDDEDELLLRCASRGGDLVHSYPRLECILALSPSPVPLL